MFRKFSHKLTVIFSVLALVAVMFQMAPAVTAKADNGWMEFRPMGPQVRAADGWIHQQVAGDVTVCAVTIGFHGDMAIWDEPNNYHVRYILDGLGTDGFNYHAEPRVDVVQHDRNDKTIWTSRDHFNIRRTEDGRFSTHIADYRFVWQNGVLIHERSRIVNDCSQP